MGVLLDRIQQHGDIKKLSDEELPALCEEIRETIISTVANNGGHLASNLGVVELCVALHRVLDFSKDCLIWDVGHQSYAHKLLTGRANAFSTLRQEGGLSGFPSREESDCDPFTSGHSSASISAALGLTAAKEIRGEEGHVVAVIGDGALTGGLAFEGLNNAGRLHRNLIVILNDNTMSISRNVGSIARYLTYVRSRPAYLNAKDNVESVLLRIPRFGQRMASAVRRFKNAIKRNIYNTTIFEDLGFTYYGPVDGHDLPRLISMIQSVSEIKKPVLLHVRTYKGRGYKYAEENPRDYHGLAAFDREKGLDDTAKQNFSGAFGEALCALAQEDERICAITAAMETGTGLVPFHEQFRSRFFDVGIAEAHAVTFSAGLARGGLIPVFAVYSTFLQRAYDQLIHDVALQKLKVILAIDRAGIIGEDGRTHQGIYDIAFLRTVPNAAVYAPSYYDELTGMLRACVEGEDRLYAVRYPRGQALFRPENYVPNGQNSALFGAAKSDVTLVTFGRQFSFAAEAAETLREEGISCRILKLNRIIPLDTDAVDAVMDAERILFFEEGTRNGGVGEAFGEALEERGFSGTFSLHAIEEGFVPHAQMFRTLSRLGLDRDGMVRAVRAAVKKGSAE